MRRVGFWTSVLVALGAGYEAMAIADGEGGLWTISHYVQGSLVLQVISGLATTAAGVWLLKHFRERPSPLRVRRVLKTKRQDLLAKANVVGVGSGNKNGRPAVIVMVTKKMPEDELSKGDLVPPKVGGQPTDVVETGKLVVFDERTSRNRPAFGGDSVGHFDISAGTLGGVVYDADGKRAILSNNHVMANSNNGAVGDPILQPGPHDGGTDPDTIARLSDFVPVVFGGGAPTCPIGGGLAGLLNWLAGLFGRQTRVRADTPAENRVDAAVAVVDVEAEVSLDIRDIGPIMGTAAVAVGTPVKKSGRTTGFTEDAVQVVDATVSVSYGDAGTAQFVGQVIAGPMSAPGDSGSLVLDADNRVVGLLFAGSDSVTIFSPIQFVLDELDVEF